MSQSDSDTVKELISFLSNPRADVRQTASSVILSLTGSSDKLQQCIKGGVVRPLCRLISDLFPIAENAIKALINITASQPLASIESLDYDIIRRVMNQLEEVDWPLKDLSLMLLANITVPKEGSELMASDGKKSTSEGVYLEKLTQWFLENEPEPKGINSKTNEPEWDDDYQYVANILSNITQVEAGRKFLFRKKQSRSLLADLIGMMNSPNVIRRRGITGTIRNMCFDTEEHYYLYEELNVVPKLQFSLAGPEALDDSDKEGMNPSVYRLGEEKKRETDRDVRAAVVDTLLLLCTTRDGRNALRKRKVYPIVRNAHLVESDEEISEQIYKLVDFLIRDEEGEEPDWDEIRRTSMATSTKSSNRETPTLQETKTKLQEEVKDARPSGSCDVQLEEEDIPDDMLQALNNEVEILNVESSDDEDMPELI